MTPGGRKKTVSALVVVGNKKGAVGTYMYIHINYNKHLVSVSSPCTDIQI